MLRAEEGAEISRRHNLAFSLVVALMSLGLSLTGRGNYDRGFSVFEEGLALAEKIGEEFHRNRLINCIGWVQAECGNLASATEYNERSARLSGERGDVEARSNAELNMGDLCHIQRDDSLAREHYEEVHGVARKPSTSDWMKWRYSQHSFAGLGRGLARLGRSGKGRRFLQPVPGARDPHRSRKYLVRGWRLKGEIARARLQWEDAEKALRKSLTLRSGSATRPSCGRPSWRLANFIATPAASMRPARHSPRRAKSSTGSAGACNPGTQARFRALARLSCRYDQIHAA